MKLPDGVGAAHSHGHLQGAHQVLGAIRHRSGAVHYLLQRSLSANLDAGAARQFGVGVSHPPIIAAPRGFRGLGKGRPDHHPVGPAGNSLAQIAAGADAAIGDDRYIAAGAVEIILPGGGAFQSSRYLGDADAGNFPGSAGRAGADAHQNSVNAGFHQFPGHIIADAVAHDDRHIQGFQQFGENQAPIAAGLMAGGGDGGLHHYNIGAGFHGDRGHSLGILRSKRNGAYRAAVLDFLHPPPQQILPHRLGIDLLQMLGDFALRHRGYFLQHRIGILVAGIKALAVQHPQAAHFVHQHGKAGGYRAVHSRGQHRRGKGKVAEGHSGGGHIRVDGYAARDNRHFVEAVRAFQFLEKASCHSRLPPCPVRGLGLVG